MKYFFYNFLIIQKLFDLDINLFHGNYRFMINISFLQCFLLIFLLDLCIKLFLNLIFQFNLFIMFI